jgi:hypothetical protein
LVLSAQPAIDLDFQGKLTDGSGEVISGDQFEFSVTLMSATPAKGELMKQQLTLQTDQDGWFGFMIPGISTYMLKEGQIQEPLVISLEFFPNEETTWLKDGQDFVVSYTLTPTVKDEAIYLKMLRMEGSELTAHREDHLYVFKDEYPFAYLTGGFLLTDAPPLADESKDDLREWMNPEPTDGTSTRGVKGGFAKGGYGRKR